MASLAAIIARLPEESVWCVGGIGSYQLNSLMLGLTFGNGVRTGLEDSQWKDWENEVPASNFESIKKICNIGKLLGKNPMYPKKLRRILKISEI